MTAIFNTSVTTRPTSSAQVCGFDGMKTQNSYYELYKETVRESSEVTVMMETYRIEIFSPQIAP